MFGKKLGVLADKIGLDDQLVAELYLAAGQFGIQKLARLRGPIGVRLGEPPRRLLAYPNRRPKQQNFLSAERFSRKPFAHCAFFLPMCHWRHDKKRYRQNGGRQPFIHHPPSPRTFSDSGSNPPPVPNACIVKSFKRGKQKIGVPSLQ